jgi:hypothetical protein
MRLLFLKKTFFKIKKIFLEFKKKVNVWYFLFFAYPFSFWGEVGDI